MLKVLVTGATGHLGAAITSELGSAGEVLPLSHGELDIADDEAVRAVVRAWQPTAIVNCAAYNDVDGAEEEVVQALSVNAFGVHTLARIAGERGLVLVHFGTDFVFDGEAAQPYTELDQPNPKGVYAASKLLGEWFARDAPQHYVLRVESLFGGPTAGVSARAGSVGRILDGIREGREVPVFTDRTVSPSYAIDVAQAARAVLERRPPPGLYHCVNAGTVTWHDLAVEAARLMGRTPRLRPITLADVPLKANRPKYCALSSEKLALAGIPLPSWRDALQRYLENKSGMRDEE
jgi:dTDP-4-dehydrorhamnose reductase